MDITITPKKLSGTTEAIPSKSHAHRLMICSAFADEPTELCCPEAGMDIQATAACLEALGAEVRRTKNGFLIKPIDAVPKEALLPCGESGSTLRFMLPIAGALGVDATFLMEGRLPRRPLSPLWEEMERMGCRLSYPTPETLRCQGKLISGDYHIDGGVSSQFITGLLYALSLLPQGGRLHIKGKPESAPYIDMTRKAMSLFGVNTKDFCLSGGHSYRSPGQLRVEGDWSSGAFFLAAKALGNAVEVTGLDINSPQGDRAAAHLLPMLEENITVDAADIPDLVPILAVVAGAKRGAVFTNTRRLRLKESDRVDAVISMLRALGGQAQAGDNSLTVFGTGYTGGVIDAFGDHRIAMSAAIAATLCTHPVTVLGAECVNKSFPGFWEEYRRLGGII